MAKTAAPRRRYISGFCNNRVHDRCLPVSLNGSQATNRYVLCSCTCHDNNKENFETVTSMLSEYPVDTPSDMSLVELLGYVDAVNAHIRSLMGIPEPVYVSDEEEDD